MSRISSISEWFEESGQSIEDYRNGFANAAIAMLEECNRVSFHTTSAVTYALYLFNELIGVCDDIICNEKRTKEHGEIQ
jgi:hypothetical protein